MSLVEERILSFLLACYSSQYHHNSPSLQQRGQEWHSRQGTVNSNACRCDESTHSNRSLVSLGNRICLVSWDGCHEMRLGEEGRTQTGKDLGD